MVIGEREKNAETLKRAFWRYFVGPPVGVNDEQELRVATDEAPRKNPALVDQKIREVPSGLSTTRSRGWVGGVCVCFLPIHSGHQVRWTYQPGSHRRKVTQDF